MEHDSEPPPEALFKANKRRKIVQRRNISDLEESSITQIQQDTENASELYQVPTVRRPAARKHGIAFSSSAPPPPSENLPQMETSLVPAKKDEDVPTSIDRFTKPTGKLEVVQDKHLTAYIDSKLAEMRSTGRNASNVTQPVPEEDRDEKETQPEASGIPMHSQDILTNDRQGHRDSNPTTRRATKKHPRRVKQKDPSELAREAMIEQILGESQVPMYDQTSSSAPQPAEDDGVDHDEAVAEAFKAEFLASLQERKRRKTAAQKAAAAGGKGAAPAPSGPKLGGSRSQREKMRQIEEAKNAGPSGTKR